MRLYHVVVAVLEAICYSTRLSFSNAIINYLFLFYPPGPSIREENVALHEATGLFTKTANELEEEATLRNLAKLAVIDITDNVNTWELIYHIRYPLETIAILFPHPWPQHMHKLHGTAPLGLHYYCVSYV